MNQETNNDFTNHRNTSPLAQLPMFGGNQSMKIKVLKTRKDHTDVFPQSEFKNLRAVSYVTSAEIPARYLEVDDEVNIELVVGENLTRKDLTDVLRNEDYSVIEELASYVEDDRLKIFVPRQTVHSKFYIYDMSTYARVIHSSANLTHTASEPSRQVNSAVYWDLSFDGELLRWFVKHYESHKKDCSLFMDDLTKLFRDQPETPRDRLVQQWLMRTDNGSDFIDTRQVMEEFASQIPNALDAGSSEPLIMMKLPAAPNVRKNLRKILVPTEPKGSQGELHIDPSRYIKHTNDVYGLPFLRHDLEKRRLWLGFNDSWDQLAEAPSSLSEVSRALEHVENYMDTVDLGKSTEKLQVKMSMYESLLYILASPFFCAFMKDKRIRTGKIDRRGPRYLFIHGPSHNGKSTFLRFALKIMTGFDVTPLGRTGFTKTRIADRISLVNVFPFVFDDITVSSSGGHEDLLKSYWETWWHDEYTHFPQLIMTG